MCVDVCRLCVPAGGITEEQYHSHQQQLAQMQKQQLEQLQLQNTTVSYRHTALHQTQVTYITHMLLYRQVISHFNNNLYCVK